jgi:hypothetical protein
MPTGAFTRQILELLIRPDGDQESEPERTYTDEISMRNRDMGILSKTWEESPT